MLRQVQIIRGGLPRRVRGVPRGQVQGPGGRLERRVLKAVGGDGLPD